MWCHLVDRRRTPSYFSKVSVLDDMIECRGTSYIVTQYSTRYMHKNNATTRSLVKMLHILWWLHLSKYLKYWKTAKSLKCCMNKRTSLPEDHWHWLSLTQLPIIAAHELVKCIYVPRWLSWYSQPQQLSNLNQGLNLVPQSYWGIWSVSSACGATGSRPQEQHREWSEVQSFVGSCMQW